MADRRVGVYLALRSGPGCPRGWRALLSFRDGYSAWWSAYSAAGGDIYLRHYRLGPVVWGFHLRALEGRS